MLRRETKLAEGFGLGLFFFVRKKKVRWPDLLGKKKNPRATGALVSGYREK